MEASPLQLTFRIDAAHRRTISERIAIRAVAVSAGGGLDARVRHHGFRQSRAWLALHDGRLLRRDVCHVDGEFCLWRVPVARRDAVPLHRAVIHNPPPFLPPRSSLSLP